MARPPMANFWMHGGLLLFDNRKMAKSLGNFEPLSALLERHDPQAIRWLFLQTGYRKVMNFTEESIAAAALGLARIKAAYRLLGAGRAGRAGRQRLEFDARMEAALDDDMNTAAALAALYDFAGALPRIRGSLDRSACVRAARLLARRARHCAERLVAGRAARRTSPRTSSSAAGRALRDARVDGALQQPSTALTPQEAIERIVVLRNEARRAKDWAASDRLRDALQRCGIEVKDSKEGTTWSVAASSSERRRERPVTRAAPAGRDRRASRLRRPRLRHPRGGGGARRGRRAAHDSRRRKSHEGRGAASLCSRRPRSSTSRCVSSGAPSSIGCRSRRIKASSQSRRRFRTPRCTICSAAARPDATRTLVVLDHLTDPHNVGAIIRTAEAAGADGLILPSRRSAGVNATVRKAAAGAAAHLPIARVPISPRPSAR